MNSAFRFGAQQGAKPRTEDDLKNGATNGGAATRARVNLPTRDHLEQIAKSCRRRGRNKRLVVAMADYADAYKQLALRARDEHAAVVVPRNPIDRRSPGFVQSAQLFGFDCGGLALHPLVKSDRCTHAQSAPASVCRVLRRFWPRSSSSFNQGGLNSVRAVQRAFKRAPENPKIRGRRGARFSRDSENPTLARLIPTK